jgi:hypothetical protein
METKKLPKAWRGGPAKRGECPNCGEPYYRHEGFSNKRAKCPHCNKWGCSTCVTYRETGTCCCSPE